MAQLQIDLSASNGLYRKIDGANYYSENNNNLIYDAENGQVVSGVYNPFRMPGYISPAVDAWVNVSFDMPSWSGADPSRGIITGIQEGDTYIISTTDFQIKPVAISISQFAVTGFTLLTNLSQPGNTHSMIVGELNGVNTIYHVSGSKVHSTASSTALVTGLEANNWQSSVASNPKGLNSLYENNRTGFVDGKNRLMYVYDKYAIHAIDGSDVVPASGIFNADILRFPTNYLITGGVEFRGKIYFGYALDSSDSLAEVSHNPGIPDRCGVFIWNKRSITGSEYDSIAIDGVSSIRQIWNDGEALFLMTTSVSGKLQIRQFDGKTFVIIHELGKQFADTNYTPPKQIDETVIGKNAITVTDIGSMFMTNLGNVYCLTLGGRELHKINEMQYLDTPEIEYIETNSASPTIAAYGISHSPSQGKYVASGYPNTIYTSTNGTSWTTIDVTSVSSGASWMDNAYSQSLDMWVAVSNSSSTRAMSSTNGSTWTARTITNTSSWQCVRWFGGTVGKFIASAAGTTNNIAYSSNGTSWTTITITGKSFSLRPFCFNPTTNEVFLISTDGTIHKSTDGISWSVAGTAPTASSFMAYSPTLNLYAIKSSSDKIYTTEDFITYNTIDYVYGMVIDWIPDAEMFIVTRVTTEDGFTYSTDGVTFKSSNSGGTLNYVYVWSTTDDKLVSVRVFGSSSEPTIMTSNLIVNELDVEKERQNYETSNVLIYGSSYGYATDNAANGLNGIIPHLKAFYYSENYYKNRGLRGQFLFLHNIGKISSQDFNATLDLSFGGKGKFSKNIYPLEGNVLTGVRLLPKLSIAQNLTVYCKPVPNDAPELEDAVIGYIDIYVNQKTTPVQTKVVTRKIASKGYIDIEMNQLNVNAIQIGIRWNTEHQTGENDMMLSQAVLTYKPIYSSR